MCCTISASLNIKKVTTWPHTSLRRRSNTNYVRAQLKIVSAYLTILTMYYYDKQCVCYEENGDKSSVAHALNYLEPSEAISSADWRRACAHVPVSEVCGNLSVCPASKGPGLTAVVSDHDHVHQMGHRKAVQRHARAKATYISQSIWIYQSSQLENSYLLIFSVHLCALSLDNNRDPEYS